MGDELVYAGDGTFMKPPSYEPVEVEPPHELAWDLIQWAADESNVLANTDLPNHLPHCVLCGATAHDTVGAVYHRDSKYHTCFHIKAKAAWQKVTGQDAPD